jgi:hypothetical protein
LAETLLRAASEDEQVMLIAMRRFGPGTQKRFQDLMERHNEGQLNPSERAELKRLVAHYKAMMLFNTEALLKATSPELFTKSGRLKRRRLDRALRQRAPTPEARGQVDRTSGAVFGCISVRPRPRWVSHFHRLNAL